MLTVDYKTILSGIKLDNPIHLRKVMNSFEAYLVVSAYNYSGRNKSKAADLLGIIRTNFHNKFAKAINDKLIVVTDEGYRLSKEAKEHLQLPESFM